VDASFVVVAVDASLVASSSAVVAADIQALAREQSSLFRQSSRQALQHKLALAPRLALQPALAPLRAAALRQAHQLELEPQLAPPQLHYELVLRGCSQIHAACAAPWVEAVIGQRASFPLFGTHASLAAFARGRELEPQLVREQCDRGGLQACQGRQVGAAGTSLEVAARPYVVVQGEEEDAADVLGAEVEVRGEVDDSADGLGAEVEVRGEVDDAADGLGAEVEVRGEVDDSVDGLGADEDGQGVDEGDGLDEVGDLRVDCQYNVLASLHDLPEHEDGLDVDEVEGAGVGVSCSGDEGLDVGDGPGVDEVEGAAVEVNCLDDDDALLRLDEDDGILDANVVAE